MTGPYTDNKAELTPTSTVEERVIAIITGQCPTYTAQSTSDTYLITDLTIDRVDMPEFFMKIEGGFGIAISDAQAQQFITVGELTRYIKRRTR